VSERHVRPSVERRVIETVHIAIAVSCRSSLSILARGNHRQAGSLGFTHFGIMNQPCIASNKAMAINCLQGFIGRKLDRPLVFKTFRPSSTLATLSSALLFISYDVPFARTIRSTVDKPDFNSWHPASVQPSIQQMSTSRPLCSVCSVGRFMSVSFNLTIGRMPRNFW